MTEKHFTHRPYGSMEQGDLHMVEGCGQSFPVQSKIEAVTLEIVLENIYKIAESRGYERGFQTAYGMKDGSGLWNYYVRAPGVIVSTPKNG